MVIGPVPGLLNAVTFALTAGLMFGGLACLQHLAIRVMLAYNGFAPLGCVSFLDEATDRLFLCRAGSGYLFVHRLLLEHFANMDTAEAQPP